MTVVVVHKLKQCFTEEWAKIYQKQCDVLKMSFLQLRLKVIGAKGFSTTCLTTF